jgi:hypothetical protein
MDRRPPENGITKPTLTVRPDWLDNHEQTANTGEYPRKRWISGERVRLCSRLFVGLETAKGSQRARTGQVPGASAAVASHRLHVVA